MSQAYQPYLVFAAIASAAFTTLLAIFSEAASINRPSNAAAPFPCAAASFNAIKIRFAFSTSAVGGVKISLANSTCEG